MDRATVSLLIGLEIGKIHNKFKSREVVSDVVRNPVVIRLDGVKFGKKLRDFERPRDRRVHNILIEAGIELMKYMGADIAHVVSDEINIVFLNYVPYGGRYFKLISTSSGIASSITSLRLGRELYFDSRIVEIYNPKEILEYLMYRARVGMNNYLSQLCYMNGIVREYTPNIEELILHTYGKYRNIENWELFGTLLYKCEIVKRSIDKLTGEIVNVRRKIIKISEFSTDTLVEIRNILLNSRENPEQ